MSRRGTESRSGEKKFGGGRDDFKRSREKKTGGKGRVLHRRWPYEKESNMDRQRRGKARQEDKRSVRTTNELSAMIVGIGTKGGWTDTRGDLGPVLIR